MEASVEVVQIIPKECPKMEDVQSENSNEITVEASAGIPNGMLLQDDNIPISETKAEQNAEPTIEAAVNTPQPIQSDVVAASATTSTPQMKPSIKETNPVKKDDDKLGMYKALAIKLKKELVKSRDELQRVRAESEREITNLNEQVGSLKETVDAERLSSITKIATLEASVKNLKSLLAVAENDLQSIQVEFENYKVRATKIMQQNASVQLIPSRTFEEERYKQFKELNDEQSRQIRNLETQISKLQLKNSQLEGDILKYREEIDSMQTSVDSMKDVKEKCEMLVKENENLKVTLKRLRTNPSRDMNIMSSSSRELSQTRSTMKPVINSSSSTESIDGSHIIDLVPPSCNINDINVNSTDENVNPSEKPPENSSNLSPTASVKDDSNTSNSNSSFDGSTSGYVHIKPTTFEIISRSSVLQDAQNQIDDLTKAYLDSENTNSLLSEQVRALKEEIRRMQRGTERLDLAENLEYLKNVVFKFISLDNSQSEQRQRLVPVLSTVLKLSPDETAKLNSLSVPERTSMTSSFFKI